MRKLQVILSLNVLLTYCLLLAACSSNEPSKAENIASPTDVQEAQKDIASGNLKFEIRGLTNEGTKGEYGSTTFRHTAVVVPVGNSKYAKGTYLVIFANKRLAGGDPEHTRRDDDITIVMVRDGIGRFEDSGGYRTKEEKWEPERIEVRPIVAFVGTPMDGTPVQEK